MIRVENVSKSFGSKKALHQISFEIKEGEIFGFLGPSGSGKTTMINVLTGQLAADQGKTVLLGKNSQDLTSKDLEQIGIVSDGSGFYEKMSLYKNLLIYAKLYGLKSDRVVQVLQQVGLADAKDIIQKYHVDKKVRVVYNDGREQIVPFEELPHLDTTDLMVVHSCEPTLEEIFIRLTGEKLDV